MKGFILFTLLLVVFVSDYAIAQPCPCDTLELSNGTTGNDIVELLCPGGELGEDTSFILTPEEVSIQSDTAGYEVITPLLDIPFCAFGQAGVGQTNTKLVGQQIADCRQRLIEGCNLNRTPIPTLSGWGLIAMAVIIGAAGLFMALRRKKAAA